METVKGELVPVTNGKPQAMAPAQPAATESYIEGFVGMATGAFSKEIVAALTAPINHEDVEIKPDGIVYLPGVFYRQRLIQAFGPGGWALAPRAPVRTRDQGGGTLVIYAGALFAHGRFVSEAMGQCVYWPKNAGMTYADAAEGAKTDCITRCCKDLGIAHELWDPGWRGEWQRKYATKGPDGKWKRLGREPRLTSVPTAVAGSSSGHASGAPTESDVAGAPDVTPGTQAQPRYEDTGEAPTDEALDELEQLAFKTLKWRKPFAALWLTNRFGTNNPGTLTARQVQTALYLLYAWGEEGDKGERYKAALAKVQGEGKCR